MLCRGLCVLFSGICDSVDLAEIAAEFSRLIVCRETVFYVEQNFKNVLGGKILEHNISPAAQRFFLLKIIPEAGLFFGQQNEPVLFVRPHNAVKSAADFITRYGTIEMRAVGWGWKKIRKT